MNIAFLWSAIHQQLCIVGRSFEVRKMVKEALGKVESVRVTSSGFDFMRLRRAEGESIVFFGAGHRLNVLYLEFRWKSEECLPTHVMLRYVRYAVRAIVNKPLQL
jgi:hypothetical protein